MRDSYSHAKGGNHHFKGGTQKLLDCLGGGGGGGGGANSFGHVTFLFCAPS